MCDLQNEEVIPASPVSSRTRNRRQIHSEEKKGRKSSKTKKSKNNVQETNDLDQKNEVSINDEQGMVIDSDEKEKPPASNASGNVGTESNKNEGVGNGESEKEFYGFDEDVSFGDINKDNEKAERNLGNDGIKNDNEIPKESTLNADRGTTTTLNTGSNEDTDNLLFRDNDLGRLDEQKSDNNSPNVSLFTLASGNDYILQDKSINRGGGIIGKVRADEDHLKILLTQGLKTKIKKEPKTDGLPEENPSESSEFRGNPSSCGHAFRPKSLFGNTCTDTSSKMLDSSHGKRLGLSFKRRFSTFVGGTSSETGNMIKRRFDSDPRQPGPSIGTPPVPKFFAKISTSTPKNTNEDHIIESVGVNTSTIEDFSDNDSDCESSDKEEEMENDMIENEYIVETPDLRDIVEENELVESVSNSNGEVEESEKQQLRNNFPA